MKGAIAEPLVSTMRPPKIGHHDEDGHQPILLADAQKRPEFAKERQHAAQNWFFMDSGAGPGGVRSIQ